METGVDAGQVILDRIAAREVERARLEAETAVDMLELANLRRGEAESQSDRRVRDLQTSFAADELGIVLHLPTRTVQCRLAESRRVRGLLPLTWEAFVHGQIDAYRISVIASAAAKLRGNGFHVFQLDRKVADEAPTRTVAQLKAMLKRLVARLVPDGVAARCENAKRGVWLDHQDNGMTYLNAYIPTTDALQIDVMLTARAKGHTDDRTFDQRRADELVAQMLGHNSGHNTGHNTGQLACGDRCGCSRHQPGWFG